MSYIDNHLLPGEVVTFRTHLHWKIFVMPVLTALVVMALEAWLVARYRDQWTASTNRTVMIVATVVLALALVGVLVAWVRRRSSEFAVTNKRVIIKMGVTTTHSMELLLSKIEGITVTQSVPGRMFNFGEIVVTGSGGTHEPFDNIQAPLAFRQAVQAATTA
ncbi:MAG TPA: PH domain-containing protein [Gemmatimonadales bacterium]|jgi:uncharacterized membrane protein YdbT with pleckstrin-like domain